MTDNLIMPILQNLQQGQADIKHDISNINIQLCAINERLSGQLISELGVRSELNELKTKVQLIEKRLELNDQT